MSLRIRTDLDTIPDYIPGRNHPDAIKLASNEASAPPLPEALAAVAEAMTTGHRYPDNGAITLVAQIAAALDVAEDQVTTGCGSVSLYYDLSRMTCSGPADEIVMPWRSFEAYPIGAHITGATPVPVPLTDEHAHDLHAMAAAVGERTRLVLVCNPNNPTGTAVGSAALERFLDAVDPNVLVVIDEAYREYLRLPHDHPDGVELGRRRPNVVVLRTFSKAYGLAGLRVGYAIGDRAVIAALNKVRAPFSVSTPAQAAAAASLKARDSLLARTDEVIKERERVHAALLDADYAVPPSEANFVWLPLGARTNAFTKAAAGAGLLVRGFSGDGVRVTIDTPEHNEVFLTFATDPVVAGKFTEPVWGDSSGEPEHAGRCRP